MTRAWFSSQYDRAKTERPGRFHHFTDEELDDMNRAFCVTPGCAELSDEIVAEMDKRERQDVAIRERDEAISLLKTFKESESVEILRLREALERIYQSGRGLHVEIARDALNA